MPSGKTVKLILYEGLQFAALIVPIFVVMERFASLICDVRGRDLTAYWLVVSMSMAYVTSVALLVWVPLKYLILRASIQILPASLLNSHLFHSLLSVLLQVQVDRGLRLDHFTELPVSLVLVSLICVDIIERIPDGLDSGFDMPGPVLTLLEQVTTVTGQLHADEVQDGSTQGHPEARNGSTSGRWQDLAGSPGLSTFSSRAPSTAYLYSSSSRDGRSEVFVDSFLFWLDTVEMVRVAGEPSVFYSAWVFPIYILAFMSTLRLAITPNSPLMSSAGFALQDLPFLILRVSLIVWFGYVTPLLYPLKNVLVSLTFIYFTFLSKLRICKRQSMF
uniref:Transmembrane protein 236 n=1 Tax=Cyclopterus lumpus TaxID=8103 RepID=A0A8C3AKA2_CYCLU